MAFRCKIQSLRLNGNEISQKHATYQRNFLLKCQSIAYLDVGHCERRNSEMLHRLQAIDICGMQQCHSLMLRTLQKSH